MILLVLLFCIVVVSAVVVVVVVVVVIYICCCCFATAVLAYADWSGHTHGSLASSCNQRRQSNSINVENNFQTSELMS